MKIISIVALFLLYMFLYQGVLKAANNENKVDNSNMELKEAEYKTKADDGDNEAQYTLDSNEPFIVISSRVMGKQ